MSIENESLIKYFKGTKAGEDVLIEYTSEGPIHLLFYLLLRCLEKSNLPVVIVDELDQLHVFKTQLKLAGVDTGLMDNLNVIKIGGVLKTGNVLSKIGLSKGLPIRKNTMKKP